MKYPEKIDWSKLYNFNIASPCRGGLIFRIKGSVPKILRLKGDTPMFACSKERAEKFRPKVETLKMIETIFFLNKKNWLTLPEIDGY